MATRKDISPVRRKAPTKSTAERIAPVKRTFGAAKSKLEDPLLPRRERRALSHVGGEVEFQGGTPEEQDALGFALSVSADEGQVMAHVHGFHSYPARLHPLTAARIVERFSRPGDTVVDPFCGSGTVVIEAHSLGRKAFGSDLNPLAVELAWLKSKGFTKKFLIELQRTATNIAEVAEERRKTKAEPLRRYDEETRERYPIHILLELDSISASISDLPRGDLQRILRLIVSSILTKVSYSEGDTTRQKAPRRLPSGFAIQLFSDKTTELCHRLSDYADKLPPRPLRAQITHADARRLEYLDNESVNLVVSSPPYPGVYNYLEHHLHRLKWLGLRESQLENYEIGARRVYRRMTLEEAAIVWQKEIGDVLAEVRRILTRDGRAVFIIADSVIDRQALRGDEQIFAAAERAGMKIVAIASQPRPLFLYGAEEAFGDDERKEHVVVLRPGPRPKRPERTPEEGEPRRGDEPNPWRTFRGGERGPHAPGAENERPVRDQRPSFRELSGPPRASSGPPRERSGPSMNREGGPRERSGFSERHSPSRGRDERNTFRDTSGPPRERSGFGDRSGPPRERSGFGDRSGPPRERGGPPRERSGPPRDRNGPPRGRGR